MHTNAPWRTAAHCGFSSPQSQHCCKHETITGRAWQKGGTRAHVEERVGKGAAQVGVRVEGWKGGEGALRRKREGGRMQARVKAEAKIPQDGYARAAEVSCWAWTTTQNPLVRRLQLNPFSCPLPACAKGPNPNCQTTVCK